MHDLPNLLIGKAIAVIPLEFLAENAPILEEGAPENYLLDHGIIELGDLINIKDILREKDIRAHF